MPIYEYERTDGQRFEIFQKITEEPLKSCPTTGLPVRKLVSNTAFMLKGGGWYRDGYTSGESKPKQTNATSSPSESTPKTTSSTNPSTPTVSKGDQA